MPRPKEKEPRHRVAQLSATTFRIVECYVRLAPKAQRCFLIDTGCGLGNLRKFIEDNINIDHWPYTVICTHFHFDHIAANHLFKDEQICFGGADKEFVLKSRGMPMPLYEGGHLGNVIDYPITQWLQDGELIPLDKAEPPQAESSLQVIFTPGHSPDSISLWDPEERRLFCGDFMYPSAAWDDPLSPPGGLYAMCEGSSMSVYHKAMLKVSGLRMEGP
ncbi:hypothetical protein WJX73_008507 [Symbiochloris irregularis]|uniref:Metallo-beta-lactamase domain-containing protein n=1 Tax=Symbiochloris irregularis TaxID=706552 RepID=A0AAW1PUZ0_9CHLO